MEEFTGRKAVLFSYGGSYRIYLRDKTPSSPNHTKLNAFDGPNLEYSTSELTDFCADVFKIHREI